VDLPDAMTPVITYIAFSIESLHNVL
jgi:hypothetical protein